MAALASIFAGHRVTGSYGFGALLAGCYAVGEFLGAPWRGRALDGCTPTIRMRRMRRALLLSAVLLGGLAIAVWTQSPAPVLVLLTLLAAMTASGVPGGYRALLTELIEPDRLLPALSWDATLLEVEWLIAPVLVSAALLTGEPAASYLVMAAWALGGALLTGLVRAGSAPGKSSTHRPAADDGGANRPTDDPVTGRAAVDDRDVNRPATDDRVTGRPAGTRGAWRQPAGWPSYLTSVALGTAEGGFIAALPALLVSRHASATEAGLFAALLALGSMVGGVLLAGVESRLPGEPGGQADLAMLLLCALLAPVLLSSSWHWLVLPVMAGGLFIAPVNALRAKALEQALPLPLRSEGFSIQYGANGVGVALGSAIVAGTVASSADLAVGLVLGLPALLCVASLAVGAARRSALAGDAPSATA
jgi:Major Facilitator Superfamily